MMIDPAVGTEALHKSSPTIRPTMGRTTAFFYGTLMIPKILKNVINNDGSHLKMCPAILFVS